MDAYMYRYNCAADWYGSYSGLRNIYTQENLQDSDAIKLAKDDLKKTLGRKECDVSLLVKYKLSIESIKTYPGITKIPFCESEKSRLSLD